MQALEIRDGALKHYFPLIAFFAVQANVEVLYVDVVEICALFLGSLVQGFFFPPYVIIEDGEWAPRASSLTPVFADDLCRFYAKTVFGLGQLVACAAVRASHYLACYRVCRHLDLRIAF
jgi:hypothetical protein